LTSSKRVHAEDYVDSGIPFYRGKEISELKEHKPVSEVLYITEDKYNEMSQIYGAPEVGDLLITAVGTIGNTWVVDEVPFYFKDGNLIWFRNIKCVSRYLDYALGTPIGKKNIDASAIGSNQKALTMVKLNELSFCFPKSGEQEKIATYFYTLDRLITLQQQKCDQTKKFKKYMLQKMFPGDGQCVPEVRFSGFTDAWEQRKLGDVAGKTYGGGTPKTSEEEFWHGEIPWFQSSDLAEHEVLRAQANKGITNTGLKKSAAQLIPGKSIAIVTRVGVGKLAFMPVPYTTSQDFLSLSEMNIDEIYGCYAIYKMIQREKSSTQGTSIKGITKEELLNKIISVPCIGEQQKIGTYFSALDRLITLQQRRCDTLKEMKRFMLQNMFV
jgi:type I restriction enzyme S subunit